MSISSAPPPTASATSASLTGSGACPEGNAVATLARWVSPFSSGAATGTIDGHRHAGARPRRAGRILGIGAARLRAQGAHLARGVGAFEGGQVDHADRQVEGPLLGCRLDRSGAER